MNALPGIAWWPVQTAPHVYYAITRDRMGQHWILFSCSHCGDETKKACMDPQGRGPHWVAWYAAMHQH